MAKRKTETEAPEAGTAKGFHWWDREFFLKNIRAMVERLEADPSLVPCAREEQGEQGPSLVLYTMPAGKAASNGDDGGFDNSHFCPPFCP